MSVADTTNRAVSGRAPGARPRDASGESRLSIVVILYFVALMLPITFHIGNLALTPSRILLLIVIVPLLVNLFSGRYGRVLPVDILFVLHILWASVSLALNNPGQSVQSIGSNAIMFLGGYVVGRAYIRTPQQFIGLIKLLVLTVALTVPFAILDALTDTSYILELFRMTGIDTFAKTHYEPRAGLYRAQVNFIHPIHYGLYCSVGVSFAYVGLRNVASTFKRVLYTGVVSLAVFLSLSSGALLAALLQFGLIFWDAAFRRSKRRWLLLVGLFAFCYMVIDILSNRTPIEVMMSYATFSSHNAWWRAAIFEWGMKSVWAYPIFGLGLNEWQRPYWMYTSSMDNFWLVMAVRYGIPGFLLIVAGYINALWRVGRRKFEPLTLVSNLRLAWMFVFMGLSFTLSTVHIWEAVYTFVFFMMGAGLWMADWQENEDPGADEAPAGPAGTVLSRQVAQTLSRNHAAAPAGPEVATASPQGSGDAAGRAVATSFTRFQEEKTRKRKVTPKPGRRS